MGGWLSFVNISLLCVADEPSWRPGPWQKSSPRRLTASKTTSDGPLHRSVYKVAAENISVSVFMNHAHAPHFLNMTQ